MTAALATVTPGLRLTDADRYMVAAQLATAFRLTEKRNPTMRATFDAIRRGALAAERALADTMSKRRASRLVDVSMRVQSGIVRVPHVDRMPVALAVVRELLTDAPDVCVDLDRAMRAASKVDGFMVTEAHDRTALRIIAEVWR